MLLSKVCWKGGWCTIHGDENKKQDFQETSLQTYENIYEPQMVYPRIFICVSRTLKSGILKPHLPPSVSHHLNYLYQFPPKSPLLFFPLKAADDISSGLTQKPYQFLQGV